MEDEKNVDISKKAEVESIFNNEYYIKKLRYAGGIKTRSVKGITQMCLLKVPNLTVGLVLAALTVFPDYAVLRWIKKGVKMTPEFGRQFKMYAQLAKYLRERVHQDDVEEWKHFLDETNYTLPAENDTGWASISQCVPKVCLKIKENSSNSLQKELKSKTVELPSTESRNLDSSEKENLSLKEKDDSNLHLSADMSGENMSKNKLNTLSTQNEKQAIDKISETLKENTSNSVENAKDNENDHDIEIDFDLDFLITEELDCENDSHQKVESKSENVELPSTESRNSDSPEKENLSLKKKDYCNLHLSPEKNEETMSKNKSDTSLLRTQIERQAVDKIAKNTCESVENAKENENDQEIEADFDLDSLITEELDYEYDSSPEVGMEEEDDYNMEGCKEAEGEDSKDISAPHSIVGLSGAAGSSKLGMSPSCHPQQEYTFDQKLEFLEKLENRGNKSLVAIGKILNLTANEIKHIWRHRKRIRELEQARKNGTLDEVLNRKKKPPQKKVTHVIDSTDQNPQTPTPTIKEKKEESLQDEITMKEEINENGKRLADIVKSTHKKLRAQFKNGKDEEIIWQEHIKNTEELQQYATAMQSLATEHWDSKKDINTSRVQWVVNIVRQYYQQKGYEQFQNKEQRKVEFLNLEDKCQEEQSHDINSLKVLDVGSCYNPFAKFTDLDVTAIDLCPANESVKQSDFLALEVNSSDINKEWNLNSSITSAPEQYFDVIIFSLLLEYIPSPRQRFLACKKAYRLLKTNGILCIITPDSKNLNVNVHLYKLWKITLGFLGFARTNYEKMTHFHGMAFRKGICSTAWAQDAERELDIIKKKQVRKKFGKIEYDNIQNEIYIPQDFKDTTDGEDEDYIGKIEKNVKLINKNIEVLNENNLNQKDGP